MDVNVDAEQIALVVLKLAAKRAGKAAFKALRQTYLVKADAPNEETVRRAVESALERHLKFVASWSAAVQPVGASSPSETDAVTVPLDMTDLPRRYSVAGGPSGQSLGESDLLGLPAHFLLTGDPGGGKTTTVKRLSRALVTAEPTGADEPQYPIVIECRNVGWRSTTLGGVLRDLLGLPVPPADTLGVVAEALEAAHALVMLDGLDEVPFAHGRAQLENDIQALGHRLHQARMLVSCRSGDAPHLEGFTLAELRPLTGVQVEGIVRRKLGGEADAFMGALRDSPAMDLSSRPLLLEQMLTVYENQGGQLPQKPTSLYRRLTKLLLEDWDMKRRVKRHSQYAAFGPDDKVQFLSALSYHLTIEGQARFSTQRLIDIYAEICEQFDLPPREAEKVANEIETHSGLIIQRGEMYEFSHLSLQEYLCGDHLARIPDAKKLAGYIDRYPEPVAVAVALSSEPSMMLARLVLKKGAFNQKRAVRAFAYRLGRERPGFVVSPELGHAVLKLMFSAADDDLDAFAELAKAPAVTRSLAAVAQDYTRRKAAGGISLRYSGELEAGRAVTPPPIGRVSHALWKLMLPDVTP